MDYIEFLRHLKSYFKSILSKHIELIDKNGPLTLEAINAVQNTHDFLQQAIKDGEDDYMPCESIDEDIYRFLKARQLDIPQDSTTYRQLKNDFKLPFLSYCREVLAYNTGIRNYDLSGTTQSTQPATIEKTLKQAMDDFIEERKRGEAWTARTLKDRKAQLRLLSDMLGANINIAAVDALKAAEVKKTLQVLPKNRNKNPKTRDLSLKDMATVTGIGKMDTRTVNEYLTVYQSFFGWAEQQGYVQKNVFEGLQIKVGKHKAKARMPFTREQIKKILSALADHTPKKSGKSFRYWGVMLAIYTGARLNEIAQLALDDIQKDNGVWYFNITDEGDDDKKRLKNASS
ncbi:MAG: hypothetical protein Q8K65_01755, partial [Alphaproteobacteria bacterium]|nr:hypothetical protein [Alphaproteobacteria bacterium]